MNLLAYHLRRVHTEDSAWELVNIAHQIQGQGLQDGGHSANNLREVLLDDLKVGLPFNTALHF